MLGIQYFRKQQGLSQGQLADLVGTRQATISNIERGHQRPGDDLLGRIAQALGVVPAFALLQPVSTPDLPASEEKPL